MRIFSIGYLFRSASLIIKYPMLLIAFLKGRDVGTELQRRRGKEWAKSANSYRDNAKTIFGLQICLNPEDFSPVSSSIATTGQLDLSLTELIMKVLKPGMIAVDVGANIGYFTILFAKIVGPKGIVHAFEPEPFNFHLLNKTTEVNRLTNVRTYKQAVSDSGGTKSLYLSDSQMPQAHSLSHDWGRGTIEVQSTTLDEFWESLGRPPIDFVKVHVGDDDLMVLRGACSLVAETRPFITMVFIGEKWRSHSETAGKIIQQYDMYRIVHSPFLIRRVEDVRFLGDQPVPIFLIPKAGKKKN